MQPNETKWELPPKLRIDNPEVLKQAEEMRAELAQRTQTPFASLSPQEHALANAATIVKDLKRAFIHVNNQITALLTTGADRVGKLEELKAARLAISGRMAEAYATLGRFDLAAEHAPVPAVRDEYQTVLEAINRDDGEWCACAPEKSFVKQEFYSLKHGRMMPMMKCLGCGGLNVQPLPPAIAEQRAKRARARVLVAGKTPEEAKAILIAANHTEKLLKQ